MRRRSEVDVRAEELRRAAEVLAESEPKGGDVDRTIADDCAVMLEAWFERMAHYDKAIVLRSEVDNLARRMRNMGVMAKYSHPGGNL